MPVRGDPVRCKKLLQVLVRNRTVAQPVPPTALSAPTTAILPSGIRRWHPRATPTALLPSTLLFDLLDFQHDDYGVAERHGCRQRSGEYRQPRHHPGPAGLDKEAAPRLLVGYQGRTSVSPVAPRRLAIDAWSSHRH